MLSFVKEFRRHPWVVALSEKLFGRPWSDASTVEIDVAYIARTVPVWNYIGSYWKEFRSDGFGLLTGIQLLSMTVNNFLSAQNAATPLFLKEIISTLVFFVYLFTLMHLGIDAIKRRYKESCRVRTRYIADRLWELSREKEEELNDVAHSLCVRFHEFFVYGTRYLDANWYLRAGNVEDFVEIADVLAGLEENEDHDGGRYDP